MPPNNKQDTVITQPTGEQQPCEILIGETLYDCTTFRHPGGSLIKFFMGHGDATEVFREMHPGPRPGKWLKTLPHREAPAEVLAKERPTKYAKWHTNYAQWRQKLVDEGWFEHDISHQFYRMTELFVMYAVGCCIFLTGSIWLWPLGVLIAGIAQGRCGWYMHELGHYSGFKSMKLNIRLQEFFYGVGCGMSAAWWRSQHNRHHAVPQKIMHDVDLDTLPLVAFNKKCLTEGARRNPFIRTWISFQHFLFGPVTTSIVAAFWQFFLHPRLVYRKQLFMEGLWMTVRYIFMYAVAQQAEATLSQVLITWAAYNAIGSAYIFTTFAVSHTHLDVVDKDKDAHWLEYAGVYTMNCKAHWLTDWYMGYLNYQIEHHLFPTMPQYKFQKLWPQTKAFLEANGLEYDCRGFWEAMGATVANLAAVGREATKGPAPIKQQ